MKLAALVVIAAACGREPTRISVGAAASLRHAMPELVAEHRKQTGVEVQVRYGASDILGAEVEDGAALDLVVLADARELDRLVGARAIVGDSRRVVASNSIVLVGPNGADVKFATLASLGDGTKIAIGEPTTVPAGRYAQQYLEALGAWQQVQPNLVYGGDVAGVLALAKQGKARLAIVYRTDVRAASPLVVLDEPGDAPTVTIAAGIVAHSRGAAAARGFSDFLTSAPAQQILARHGFAPPRTGVGARVMR